MQALAVHEAALTKLAPAPARDKPPAAGGKRPVHNEVILQQHIQAVLDRFDVGGLIYTSYAQVQPESPTWPLEGQWH